MLCYNKSQKKKKYHDHQIQRQKYEKNLKRAHDRQHTCIVNTLDFEKVVRNKRNREE